MTCFFQIVSLINRIESVDYFSYLFKTPTLTETEGRFFGFLQLFRFRRLPIRGHRRTQFGQF